MSAIKGCPFCGCETLKLVCERPVDTDMYAIKCLGCAARGPLSLQEFAVLNWQLRESKRTVDSTGFDMSAINKVLGK